MKDAHFTSRIVKIQSQSDLERAFPTLKELRPHLDWNTYISIYQEAKKNNSYELVAIEEAEEVIALMGYRYLFDFVRGKHLYIDDLVTTEKARSKGLGSFLLKYAEDLARQNQCATLRLCTGIENERGMQFYEREGWLKRSYAYVKKS